MEQSKNQEEIKVKEISRIINLTLEQRLQGDALLGAQDTIEDIKEANGEVDEYGKAIIYYTFYQNVFVIYSLLHVDISKDKPCIDTRKMLK